MRGRERVAGGGGEKGEEPASGGCWWWCRAGGRARRKGRAGRGGSCRERGRERERLRIVDTKLLGEFPMDLGIPLFELKGEQRWRRKGGSVRDGERGAKRFAPRFAQSPY